MVTYVLGQEGAGKTKYLVHEANQEKDKDVSNIVFINTDEGQTRILDHKVRLINAKSYNIDSADLLRGFLAGILARDFDIGKVYVDGIYDIIDFNSENLEKLTRELNTLSEYAKADIYLGLDRSKEDLPSSLEAEIYELKQED